MVCILDKFVLDLILGRLAKWSGNCDHIRTAGSNLRVILDYIIFFCPLVLFVGAEWLMHPGYPDNLQSSRAIIIGVDFDLEINHICAPSPTNRVDYVFGKHYL